MDIEIKQKKYLVPRKYWTWIGGGTVLAAILLWLALGNLSSTLKVERRGLSIGEVKRTQFDDYVSVDGSVVPIQVVQISPEEGGVIRQKIVEEGAHIRKGDIIVKLSNSNLDLEILNAESELAEKQNMLRNTQITMEQDQLNNQTEAAQLSMDMQAKKRAYLHQTALQKEQLNSREEYLKSKEDYELSSQKHALIQQRLKKDAQLRRSQMEQMSENLSSMLRNVQLVRKRKERLDVRSQIDGEVGQLDIELGQSIVPGQKIGVINDLSDYKVEAKIDEHYIDRVHSGLTATFEQNGKRYELTVRKVYPEVKDGRFKIDFVFRGKRPNNIRTGQTYYVDLQLGESKQAVLIPKGTFYSVTGGNWIFVLDKNGQKAYRRNIRIGRQNPAYYEVIEGLEPGERVIVSGYEGYKDNEILILK
ncbi:MAG: HlyD family efflux transporter periplasmic adaptor subunit [Prevotella pleuritidis]|jgi:efflux transporter, RND family, MFP subunit|uniref:efflux RND transporter periplasmic adaptor subunit n=1 Tax=Hoylesella pleuritidis TaxID=407975 RepID=UPI00046983BC|nr:HlyD family efflux transporter periplasmic adaptor subunit [Hoylesella pleuritidis]MBF1554811.1 HlyD family efflux transporter periplasmic adaptor subunit [Hoylesella pleuritidis]